MLFPYIFFIDIIQNAHETMAPKEVKVKPFELKQIPQYVKYYKTHGDFPQAHMKKMGEQYKEMMDTTDRRMTSKTFCSGRRRLACARESGPPGARRG